MTGNTAMDLAAMETEAKAKARKQVSNLLQRPDQLEKTEQIRKHVARKKGSVEAMLKTAVQSQLDGVRTGLNQLQCALEDIREIKVGLEDVDETYRSISDLGDKLQKVREENSRHSQLAAAVENLKHIFNVPEVVKKTEDHIAEGRLLNAHKVLTELEMARDDLLFELHKQQSQSPTDKHTVQNYFSDVEKLSDSLFKQLRLLMQRTMVTIRREPTVIVSVLRIIEREERVDSNWTKRYQQTDFRPPGRPKNWRHKAFEVLEESVQSKIEANQMEDRAMDKMWLVRHLERTRQLVLEDLRVVKTLCGPCFPPYYEIVDKYVEMYHKAIAQHLDEVVQQGLENNEIVALLTWVASYKTSELMGHPELLIDTTKLGPLLEHRVIMELQNQYLQTLRSNFQEWMNNSMQSEVKDWHKDCEPDADDKGYFNTPLPVILFQMIEQNLLVASTINDSLVVNVVTMCLEELLNLARLFSEEMYHYKEKHIISRMEPQYFLHYMIACVNNCQTFADMIVIMQNKYYKSDIDEVAEDNRFTRGAKHFEKVAQTSCGYLLDEVFMDVTTHVQELLTKQWLSSPNAVETICITVEDYCSDFVHLRNRFYNILLDKCQDRIVHEYLKAVFGKKMAFRTYEERLAAGEKITQEGEMFRQLFGKLSNHPQAESPFDAFPLLAEVIKMKDTSMMSLEISGLVHRYPDIRPDQIVNLLLLRGDVGAREARQMVVDVVGEENMGGMR